MKSVLRLRSRFEAVRVVIGFHHDERRPFRVDGGSVLTQNPTPWLQPPARNTIPGEQRKPRIYTLHALSDPMMPVQDDVPERSPWCWRGPAHRPTCVERALGRRGAWPRILAGGRPRWPRIHRARRRDALSRQPEWSRARCDGWTHCMNRLRRGETLRALRPGSRVRSRAPTQPS